MHHQTAWLKCLWLALIILGLASCASTPPPAPVTPVPQQADPQQAFDRGNYATAARLWQERALASAGSEADGFRISAADAWLLANEANRAESLLRWIDKDSLDSTQKARLEIVQADLAYRSGYLDEAAVLLRNAQAGLPASSQARFEALQAQVALALDTSSTVELGQIQALADRMSSYDPAQALILIQSMESIPSSELRSLANRPRPDPDLDPWLDLALVIRQNLVNANQLEFAMADWKSRHEDHYLVTEDVLDLWLNYRQGFTAPAKVAVLLPDSGRLQAAAEAMRDGMMSAFMNAPDGSQILFISSGEQPESIPAAYFEAREQGAEFIIGPIQPESISALLALSDMRTPVLALNDLPADYQAPLGMADQVRGISLSQDAEIRATARAMAEAGFSRAMLLAPENEWGERITTVFSEEFLQDDRQIVVAARFLEIENDHSAVLERMLELDQSKARKQQLENTLQMQVEFEPVRRDDIDVIFLVANTTQGRLIRPQLRFHNAGDIPVYATSRIYSGIPDRTRDQDLNGIRFPSSELQIEFARQRRGESVSDEFKTASLKGGSFTSLHALGQDAWNLLPWLELMQADPDFVFPGKSGQYTTGPTANLQRMPVFAEFKNGAPARLEIERAAKTDEAPAITRSDD